MRVYRGDRPVDRKSKRIAPSDSPPICVAPEDCPLYQAEKRREDQIIRRYTIECCLPRALTTERVFGRAVSGGDDTTELLDYLVERIPVAKVKRGHLNRGPITELVLDIDGRSFRARVKNEQLELLPPVHLTAWVDLLLTKLSDAAAVDPDLGRAVLCSGWGLR